ncbi:putative fatty acyl-CoA reductase CG5065 isoform X4 [Drosophila sechellia]|uniref:putative fatty acyl-CoA reductase CG5065 isoform X4 n=1 Tax=Drosophila sechellia TaxID=7238 RepID=UPI0013DE0DA8|nr:putative fatty acyl-CoA reductase CG5065 isoform X4 [Drosophila sechellia]
MHEANPSKTARKAFSSTSSSRRSSNGCASGHDVEEEEEEQLFQEASSSTRTNSVDGSGTPFAAAVSATPVTDFYSNATVLITGGTGFVGKVLTEKLLRSFGLRKIYMLIRSKDKMSVQERLKGFFNESIFNRMREESPQLLAKVHPIRADYSAIDLDIDSADRAMLSSEVQIVFNVVASVKFNEKLSDAIDINVLGTKKILDLAMEMKHLKSFVHISTLYCNCNRKFIKEQVYENEIGYEKIMQIYRTFDDETLEKMRHCLIGQMPNTYTMTKKCAENLVNHRAFHMPAGIFRPPIDLSSARVKWMENRSCPYTTTCPMRTT